jgi:fatty acid synthase
MFVDQSVDNAVPLQPIQLLLQLCGDETSVTEPVVRLPSASGSGTDVEDDLKAGPILFMLPGLEGMASILEPLARNLNYQTICLQLGYSNLGQTVQDMAQALLPVQIIP